MFTAAPQALTPPPINCASSVALLPGAAHMSRTRMAGEGSSAAAATTLGNACGTSRPRMTPDGAKAARYMRGALPLSARHRGAHCCCTATMRPDPRPHNTGPTSAVFNTMPSPASPQIHFPTTQPSTPPICACTVAGGHVPHAALHAQHQALRGAEHLPPAKGAGGGAQVQA
jgi:hypothetical protein